MDVKLTHEPTALEKVKFVASLSDTLRIMVAYMPQTREQLAQLANSVAFEIASRPDIVESLKSGIIPGTVRPMRQLDIKDDDQKIQFKTFTLWDADRGCLCVLMEGGEEMYWEDKNQVVGSG